MDKLIDTWNGYTNSQPPQEFMDGSRAQGHDTIEAAVLAYVTEIKPDWAGEGLDDDEANDIYGDLVAYLERTRGDEWN